MGQVKLDLQPIDSDDDTKTPKLDLLPITDDSETNPKKEPKESDKKEDIKSDFKTEVNAKADEPKEGWLSKAYHLATDPLTDAPTRFGHSISQYLTDPVKDESPLRAELKGFAGGAAEGLGNVLSGFTSPLNLATLGMGAAETTAGKMGLEGLSSALSMGQKAAAVPMVAHGGYQALNPDSSINERLQGLAEASGGILAGMHEPSMASHESELPPIRPEMNPEVLANLRNEHPLPPEFTALGDEPTYKAPQHRPTEDVRYDIARNKQKMGYSEKLDLQPISNDVKTGDVVSEGAPPIREKTGNFWIDDAHRMEDEALSRRSDPVRAAADNAKNKEWNDMQEAISVNEGRFNKPNTKPIPDEDLTPQQLAVRQSYKAIEEKKHAYSQWFSEEESKLPDDEYFKPPPEIEARHKAIINDLEDRHDEIVQDYKDSVADSPTQKPLEDDVIPSKVEDNIPSDEGLTKGKAKLGTTPNVLIPMSKATPELIKQAREAGYEHAGFNDKGDWRFKKTSDGPIGDSPILESEVGTNRADLGPKKEKIDYLAEANALPRALMATMDMSAPLRQGFGLIHKGEFWKAIPSMIKAFGSEEVYKQGMQSIEEHPLFKERVNASGKPIPSIAEDMGLSLTTLGEMSRREESISSKIAENIPVFGHGVKASERAYTLFLNKLRADTFENLLKDNDVIGPNGIDPDKVETGHALANFVNVSTGRGNLGSLESSAKTLGKVLFAPRLIASRLQMLDPRRYVMGNPAARLEAQKSLLAMVGTGTAVGQLAKLAGAEVSTDPTSSDFGKIKVGNVRLDPFAGLQQYAVLASRMLSNKTTSSTTGRSYELGSKFGRQTRFDVGERFAESKLNPAFSFATQWLHGKDFAGRPFNVPEEVAQRFVPLFLQDFKNLSTNDPNILSGYKEFHPENLPLAVPGFFGMGTQLYGDLNQKRAR